MAGALTVDAEQRLLAWMLVDETTPAFEQPIIVKLMSANGTAILAGTEIVGDSYVPEDVLFSFTAATPGVQMANTFTVEFSSLDIDSNVTVVGIELWDSSESAPTRIAYGTFTPSITVLAGDPLTLAPGQVTVKIT